MKDLDFDELDKAISNVLTTEEVQPGAVFPPASSTATPQADQSVTPNVVRVTNPIQTPVQSPSFVRPRTSVDRPSFAPGTARPTAMDIVAPPSQGASRSGTTLQPSMRTAVPVTQPEEKLLEASYDDDQEITQPQEDLEVNQGWPSITPKTTVQPATNFAQVEELPSENLAEESNATPSVSEPSAQSDQVTDHMFGSFGEVVETAPVETIQNESSDHMPVSDISESLLIDKNPTPFLSGTKVEKRPLGNFATNNTVTTEPLLAVPKIDEMPTLNEQQHPEDVKHNQHVVGSGVQKSGKGLLIGAIIFLVVVVLGVVGMFVFGDQLGL